MSSRRDRVRDLVVRHLYRTGWRTASRLPDRATASLITAAGRVGARLSGRHLATLRTNLEVLTGAEPDEAMTRRAVESYLRCVAEVLALPGWSEETIANKVTTANESVLRTAYAGRGAVVALPHSGNWDLAGAWACVTGMPVTTVAEQLADGEFADFVAFRERLGMEVISHRDPHAVADLIDAVRRGRLVCLLADRDLAGTGVPVTWSGRSITMPGGPAMVARRSGAALIPAVCRYTGPRMTIVFGQPVPPQPGRAGLIAMTQQLADVFSILLRQAPQDWHMLQPFFDPEQA